MIEPARVQAALEILEMVADSLLNDGTSADVIIRKYFRTRRYAGSKDRRAVTAMVYQVIRDWGFLSDAAEGDVRRMLMLSLTPDANIETLFNGQDHAPKELTDEEKTFLSESHLKKPHHELNFPAWLDSRLRSRFEKNFEAEMESLNGRAPFDLRVNVNKVSMETVEKFLETENINFQRGKWAETALVLQDNLRIEGWDVYKNGQVEIQDEAAQVAVELVDAKPGQQVMDLCAGAGGKTLAAAAFMENKGQIYAFDNNHHRLKDLKPRAKRADVRILQGHHVDTAGGKRQKVLSEHIARMDRVILDVPCSGSGVWRRNPELKWRLDESKLQQYVRIQKNLLKEAWDFVKPGGRMIYMTCSLFLDENEQQITDFMIGKEDAKLIPFNEIKKYSDLKTLSTLPECLALSPHSHGTDGFFVAVIEKKV